MFGKVLDFTNNITFTTCTKQISESEKTLKCFEQTMRIRGYCNNLLKLYMQKDTFPFLTNLDFHDIDENLALQAMKKVDYIKVLYIPKCGHKLTRMREYHEKRLEICEIIKKHENTIEELRVHVSIFYILNAMKIKLVNCKCFLINIHEDRFPDFGINNSFSDYLNICEKQSKTIVLNISLKNLKDFKIVTDSHRCEYFLDGITINQHMDKLEYIGVNYLKDSINCIDIRFDDSVEVLPSLKKTVNSISKFHNIYCPVLKEIRTNNAQVFSADADMIPNIEEISINRPAKNTFEKEELFTKLTKLSVNYNFWGGRIDEVRMTIPELLLSVSKIPSISVLNIENYRAYSESYDFSNLKINKSLKIIGIDSDFILNYKNILREKFPNLIKFNFLNFTDEELYINGLLFREIEKLKPVISIGTHSFIVKNPNLDIFDTIRYRGSSFNDVLNTRGLFRNKRLIIESNLRTKIDLSIYFPNFREFGFYQSPENILLVSFIEIKYNKVEELFKFLELIKTNSYLSLKIIDSSNIKIYFHLNSTVHEECLFSAQISDFTEKIKSILPN